MVDLAVLRRLDDRRASALPISSLRTQGRLISEVVMLVQVITGTTRQARFSEREMAPLRYAVHILPDVMLPILRNTEDPSDLSPLAALRPRLDLLVDDLLWWMGALSAARIREGAA